MTHILVIEDDAQFREMLVQMLTGDGHQVTMARDGVEGLELLSHTQPDLIITDILMPNMDGIETVMELSRRSNSTPVIAMSGGRRSITSEFNLDSAAMLGVKATLAKPFSRADVRKAIADALA